MSEKERAKPLSYDKAVEIAKENFEKGDPSPVAINPALVPGMPPGYSHIIWDGKKVRSTLPGMPASTPDATIIATGFNDQPHSIPTVAPLPKDAQN